MFYNILLTTGILSITSSALAIASNLVVNIIAVVPFLFSQSKTLLPITVIPGGAIALFTRNSLLFSLDAKKESTWGFIISLVATVVYIVSAYVIMYLREDLMNILDRVWIFICYPLFSI